MQLDPKDLRLIDDLYNVLNEYEEQQNKVDISEFNEYRVLFLKESVDNLDKMTIRLLSTRFARRFNLYKPIEVYSNGELLFKVPQIFIPIKDVSDKYTDSVDRFRSYGNSEIPKYSTEATQELLDAILVSQQDVSEKGFQSYGEYIKEVSKSYGEDIKAFENLIDSTNKPILPVKEVIEEKEQISDINKIQGLSWE